MSVIKYIKLFFSPWHSLEAMVLPLLGLLFKQRLDNMFQQQDGRKISELNKV